MSDKIIHENDLNDEMKALPQADLLLALHDCIAQLTCEDSSLEERIGTAGEAQAVIENYTGPVHWINSNCCEGECDVCEARAS